MNKKRNINLRNGWVGQAMAEYMPTLTTIGTFGIIMLASCGVNLANSYGDVNECLESARQGIVCEQSGGPSVASNPDDTDNTTTNDNSPNDNTDDASNDNSNTNDNNDNSNTNDNNGGTDDPGSPDDTNGGASESTDDTPDVTTGDSNGGDSDSSDAGAESTETPDGITYQCPPDIDFNSLPAGTILTDQFPGVTISTFDNVNHPAMIFDSSNPSGGDYDLGTPHEDFGGPGRGPGGNNPDYPEFWNDTPLGNLIIISEDGDTSDPDDNSNGGRLFFNFDNPTNVSYMYFVDADNTSGAARVTLRDENGAEIAFQQIVPPPGSHGGDNGVFRLDFDQTGVHEIEVNFNGVSGAVAALFFCEPPAQDSDTADDGSGVAVDTEDNSSETESTDETDDNANTDEESDDNTVTTEVSGAAITSLTLINAGDDSEAGALTPGQTIDISNGYNIRADVTGDVNSVRFFLDEELEQNENAGPYAIGGDSGGNYSAWDVDPGNYELVVVAYSESNGNGDELSRYTIDITITDSSNEVAAEPMMYISTLEADARHQNRNNWRMYVTVTVVDEQGAPVSGASISGTFSGTWRTEQCTTGANGQCEIHSGNASYASINDITLTVNSVWGGDNDPFSREDSEMNVTATQPSS